MRTRVLLLSGLLALLLGPLAACSDDSDKEAPASAPTSSSTPDSGGLLEPSAAKAAFGDPATWPDGVAITVTSPAVFQPGPQAAGAGRFNVRVTVSIDNESSDPYELKDFFASVVADGPGGKPVAGSQIIDAGDGLVGVPDQTVEAGQSVSFDLAFAVASTNGVQVTASPSVVGHATTEFSTDG